MNVACDSLIGHRNQKGPGRAAGAFVEPKRIDFA
jgi:hypothetical protein